MFQKLKAIESRKKLFLVLAAVILGTGMIPSLAQAQEVGDLKVMVDTLWTLVTAFLVFWMNAGFALVESGFCREKNCVNILAKNFVVFGIASIGYLLTGFGMMFGNGSGFIGTEGLWMLGGLDNSPATGDAYQGAYAALNWTGTPLLAKFLFQLVFCGTAATIVSGCVAERIKFVSFLVFSFIIAGVIYPIGGHWIWGGGWLGARGMLDFAGSTVVHSIGGWAGLAGILVLGARIGKYKDGKVHPIPGHSMTSAALGCFILWLGWFGFNPGSTMAADFNAIAHIAVTTNTAAAMATLVATITAWILLGKPDLGMILNGSLAGLVAITAPCAFVSVGSSLVIGAVAGLLVVLAVVFFDKIRIDDPVGALSVHLVNGIWGTLAVGLFAKTELTPSKLGGIFTGGTSELFVHQLIGVLAVGAFTFLVSYIAWWLIRLIIGVRVSAEEEVGGLDYGEHGNRAYPEFHASAGV